MGRRRFSHKGARIPSSTEPGITRNDTACLSADETACRALKACTSGIVCVYFPTVVCTVLLFQLIMGLTCCRKWYPNTIGKGAVTTRRRSLRCMVPTTTVTRIKRNTSKDGPFATLTRIGSFNGTGLSPACYTTSDESDAPKSSSKKWLVPGRINLKNSNCIFGGGSGTYPLMSEAVSQDSAEGDKRRLTSTPYDSQGVRLRPPGQRLLWTIEACYLILQRPGWVRPVSCKTGHLIFLIFCAAAGKAPF